MIIASAATLLLVSLSTIFTMNILHTSGEERYMTLSDQEKQQIVDEIWSRLAAQGYTEEVIGFGYMDEGFEVLFKSEANPNVLAIICEVVGDLPLKIYENATCKKVSPSKIPSSWEDAVQLVLEKADNVEIKKYATGLRMWFKRGEPEFNITVNLLRNAQVIRMESKTRIINGTTVSVTIPYPYDWILTFRTGNATSLKFDLIAGDGVIWFETHDTIYKAITKTEDAQRWSQLMMPFSISSIAPHSPK